MTVSPNRSPSYLDWARVGRSGNWWYLFGAALIIAVWVIAQSVILTAGVAASGGDLLDPNAFDNGGSQTWVDTAITLVSFLPFFIGTLLVVKFIHGRPARSIITPYSNYNFRLFIIGVLAWGGTVVVVAAITLALRPDGFKWNYDPKTFWPAFLTVLLFVFFQTTAEELFFRGYLLQWISKATRSALLLGVISGVLFTLPHLANPELADLRGAGFLVGTIPYFAIGFALGFVSVRSGTIEMAIGAHFINNLLAATLIGANNSALGSSTLWIDTTPSATETALTSVISVVVFIALTWRAHGSGDLQPIPAAPDETVAERPAAGWFPDPNGQATYRYWDGTQWTEHTS